ncbi:agmatine deiminase family protein [Aidingimonas lacisalsi]|uniref:agmatine deiminase family protein n=1 Tax=Aidingimonas lacisalsi TaxID=2604086 RepID=UPI0011D1936C|nr:agmatine deiminase family protein [Aidingimonas lacisalsi]
MANRLFPEWCHQDAIQLTWPAPDSDWAAMLASIEATFATLVIAITRYQHVLISVSDEATRTRLSATFTRLGIPADKVRLYIAPSNDSWARDHGPISVERGGQPQLLDYTFTGWGGKFPADLDNTLTSRLAHAGAFTTSVASQSLVLEGGAIDTDGQGTLLTTTACLLNANRNPHLDRAALEANLSEALGIERFLWLENGHLEGDDTDSHIDTLARFCAPDTIAYVRCENDSDSHFAPLRAMEAELQAMRRPDGKPYRLIPLPLPAPCHDPEDGHRLPATYANFLIINGAVLIPIYGDAADTRAIQALAGAFPERDIIPIDCRHVIRQHGSLHCLTMQLPRGSLNLSP